MRILKTRYCSQMITNSPANDFQVIKNQRKNNNMSQPSMEQTNVDEAQFKTELEPNRFISLPADGEAGLME